MPTPCPSVAACLYVHYVWSVRRTLLASRRLRTCPGAGRGRRGSWGSWSPSGWNQDRVDALFLYNFVYIVLFLSPRLLLSKCQALNIDNHLEISSTSIKLHYLKLPIIKNEILCSKHSKQRKEYHSPIGFFSNFYRWTCFLIQVAIIQNERQCLQLFR